MRKLILAGAVLAAAVVGIAFLCAPGASASPAAQVAAMIKAGYDSRGNMGVNPVPMATNRPYTVSLTGGASACIKLTPGASYELQCTVDCTWDQAQFLPDAGWNIPYPDGGFGLTAEDIDGNQLAATTPRIKGLKKTMDGFCFWSASAGKAYPAEVAQ